MCTNTVNTKGGGHMISLDTHDSRPLYEQIVDSFVKLIAGGVLSADEKLPSVRSLASQLAINPNTIQKAYRELENRGYTYSIAGKGSFVASVEDTNSLRRQELLCNLDQIVQELLDLGCTPDELTKRMKGGNPND